MHALALALAVALTAAPHIPPSLDLAGGNAPPPYGIADFTSHGRGLPAWAPAPTVGLDGAAYKPGDSTWVGQGVTMAKVGTPTAWYGSPFYPDGFGEAEHYGAASLSDANHYTLGTGNDPLDFAGDFFGTIVMSTTSVAAAQYLVANFDATHGWALYFAAGGIPVFRVVGPAGSVYVTAGTGALSTGVEHTIHFARIGTTGYISVDGAVPTSTAVETGAPATSVVAYLGRSVSGGASATTTTIHEFHAAGGTTTTEAILGSQQAVMRCPSGACVPESSGTVAHVTFDASGNAVDSKGLAWTKVGTPTAYSAPYVWPGNRTPLAQPSVYFDAASYFDGGDVGDATTRFALCADIRARDVTGIMVAAKGEPAGTKSWFLDTYNNTIEFSVCNAAGCSAAVGAAAYGSWYSVCGSYEAGSGTGTVRLNVNGVAATNATLSGDPMRDVSVPMRVGSNSVGGTKFNGEIANVYVWTGADAPVSADEIDRLVRHRMGLLTEKPADVAIPFTRNDSHSACCATSNASCQKLGANFPCITKRGIERAGATSNRFINTEAFQSWTATGGGGAAAPTVTANVAIAPDGSLTADRIDFPASTGASQYSIIRQDVVLGAASHIPSVFLQSVTGTGSIWIEWWTGATVYSKECPVTPVWSLCTAPAKVTTGATWTIAFGWDRIGGLPSANHPALSVNAWGADLAISTEPLPYRAAGGTQYSGPETTIQIPDARQDRSRFAVYWLGTLAAWDAAREYRSLWSYGLADAMNSTTVYLRLNSDLNVFSYNATNLTRTWSASPGVQSVGEHSILLSYSPPLIKSRVDGTSFPGQITGGTGDGIPAASLPLDVLRAGVDTYSATGWVKRVVQCPSERNCR